MYLVDNHWIFFVIQPFSVFTDAQVGELPFPIS